MPLRVIRDDITKVKADCIVNTANPRPVIGGGTDTAIYTAAGRDTLLAERKKIGDINPGEAVETLAFKLPARFIIHTVGPVWVGGHHGEVAILRSCYENSLALAQKLGCKSIAFPLLATGANGFPRDLAIDIATGVFDKFLSANDMEIILVVFDKESFTISGKRFMDITAYIARNYVDEAMEAEYGSGISGDRLLERERRMNQRHGRPHDDIPESLDDYLGGDNMTFVEKLLSYVKASGKTAAEVYGKDHVMTKQTYYKIIADKDYHPNKYTAIAFCLSLELSLEESLDLMARAGWTLSDSRKPDLIVKWYIAHGIYSYREINDMLIFRGYPGLEQIK